MSYPQLLMKNDPWSGVADCLYANESILVFIFRCTDSKYISLLHTQQDDLTINTQQDDLHSSSPCFNYTVSCTIYFGMRHLYM